MKLFIFFFFLLCFDLQATPAGSQFDQLFLEDGLSQNYVSDIIQDKFGFMWFSTHDGLNRYDGYNFKIYRHIPDDTTSLAGNWINQIYCDNEGRIWCFLGIGGICIYIPDENRFEYLKKSDSNNSLSGNLIKSYYEDHHANMWISTNEGIDIIHYSHKHKKFIISNLKFTQTIELKNINKSYPVNKNLLLIVTTDGQLFKLTKNFKNQWHQKNLLKKEKINQKIESAYFDKNDTLWIVLKNKAVYRFTVNDDRATCKYSDKIDTKNAVSLVFAKGKKLIYSKSNQIYTKSTKMKSEALFTFDNALKAIIINNQDDIWACSTSNKLYHYSFETKQTTIYSPRNINPDFDDRVTITSIYIDSLKNIWLGTNLLGIQKLSLNKTFFPKFSEEINHSIVTSFAGDVKETVYIGTRANGLYSYNLNTNKLGRTNVQPKNISALCEDSTRALWIGTDNGDLFKKINDRIIKIPVHFVKRITSLLVDNKYIYIGTDGNGLFKYNTFAKKLEHYPYPVFDGSGIGSPYVWSIYKDKSDVIWFGLAASGLNKFNIQTGYFDYYSDGSQPGDLNNKTINYIYEKNQILWLGTYSGGLNRFDKKKNYFTAITEADGLSGNMINGILEDDSGNLWLSTNNGITKYNYIKNTFKRYDMEDGLQSNQFYPGACYKSTDGHLFFGGINGFNVFHPDSLAHNKYAPRVLITDVSIHSRKKISKKSEVPFTGGEVLKLNYWENYISIEFTALDYTHPSKNQYAIQMKGIDENWIYIKNRRYVSYTNLQPGAYLFSVKASNNDGIWNKNGISIHLIISPPFWQTSWFYGIIIILILAAIFTIFRIRLHYRLKHALEIQRIRDEEQTAIRTKTARDFHDEMGHRLTRISILTDMISRRTNNSDKEFKALLTQISDNANNIYYGTRDFIWAIDPRHDSLFEMAIRMKDFGDELFSNTNMNFRVQGIENHLDKINMSMDFRRHIPLIFKEGMTNILKHSGCKNVILSFCVNNSAISISLKDDGIGFNQNHKTAGFGLKNMQNRSQKAGIDFTIASSKDGTELKCMVNITQNGVFTFDSKTGN